MPENPTDSKHDETVPITEPVNSPPAGGGQTPLEKLRIIDQKLQDPDLVFGLVQQLFEQYPDASVVVETATGKIVLVNRQAELMFGYHRSELLEQPVEMLLPDQYRDEHVKHRTKYASDPRTRPMGIGLVLRGQNKNGVVFAVEINLAPVVTKHGSFTIATIRRRDE